MYLFFSSNEKTVATTNTKKETTHTTKTHSMHGIDITITITMTKTTTTTLWTMNERNKTNLSRKKIYHKRSANSNKQSNRSAVYSDYKF